MKRILTMLASTALLFGACNSELSDDSEKGFGTGDEGVASFSILLPGQETRALTDAGLPEEQTIESLHLYIFSGETLEKHVTPALGPNNTTALVPVSIGEKTVYAVTTQIEEDGVTGLSDGDSPIEVSDGVTKLTDFEHQLFNSLSSDIAVSGKFVMIGRVETVVLTKNPDEAEANPVEIAVDRATAKALVKYNPENVTIRPSLNASFSEARYTLCQQARRMYMTLLDGLYTPNGTATGGTYSGYLPVIAPGFKDCPSKFEDAVYADFEYTAENFNQNPVTGNTTFAVVRLKVTPAAIYSGASLAENGVTVTLTPATYDGGDFWVVGKHDAVGGNYVFSSDENYKLLYFTTEAAANSYIAAKGLPTEKATDYKAMKYAGGEAFYRINIITNPASDSLSKKYCVLRNFYYRIEIGEIRALGAPDPDGTVPGNPDEPLEADGWLVAQITVNPWTVCDMSGTVLK